MIWNKYRFTSQWLLLPYLIFNKACWCKKSFLLLSISKFIHQTPKEILTQNILIERQKETKICFQMNVPYLRGAYQRHISTNPLLLVYFAQTLQQNRNLYFPTFGYIHNFYNHVQGRKSVPKQLKLCWSKIQTWGNAKYDYVPETSPYQVQRNTNVSD